jgi:hypothetical protein
MTIFITISKFLLIRNFFHTGIISKLLSQGVRVVVLTQYYEQKDLFKQYEHKNLIFEPLIHSNIRASLLFDELTKGAVFNRTILLLYTNRILTGILPSRWFLVPRLLFLAPLRVIPGSKRFIRWLDFIINPQNEHDHLFKKYNPDAVFITSTIDSAENGVAKSAKRFNVPSLGMPKSWDNLSKSLSRVKTDYIAVWSPFMKQQATRYQGYKDDEIFITGVPQFDIYHQSKYLISREDFCRPLGLDPSKKIILYGSAGGGRFINIDVDYPEMIYKWIESGELRDAQILIRPHLGYIDDLEKFAPLEKYRGVVVDKTDQRTIVLGDCWDSSFEHLVHLYNTLHHCDVCINIASTLTLDAVACNRQVINIKFDKYRRTNASNSVQRLYKTDYIGELMDSNNTWLAKSSKEFLFDLISILEHGAFKDTDRLVKKFLYKNDGQSADRVVNSLLKVANHNI